MLTKDWSTADWHRPDHICVSAHRNPPGASSSSSYGSLLTTICTTNKKTYIRKTAGGAYPPSACPSPFPLPLPLSLTSLSSAAPSAHHFFVRCQRAVIGTERCGDRFWTEKYLAFKVVADQTARLPPLPRARCHPQHHLQLTLPDLSWLGQILLLTPSPPAHSPQHCPQPPFQIPSTTTATYRY